MKNKFAFILAALCLTACNLEEKPYGFYSEGSFYKTEADAQAATMYIYDAINYIEYSRAIVFLGGMNTDELDPKGDATQSTKDLDSWSQNNFRSNTTLGNFFKYSYITINRANAVIENVPGMNIDKALKDRFTGEAYFMRAYSYFNLARNFGRVPVHMKVVATIDDTAAGLAESLDQQWGYIIDDLKDKTFTFTGQNNDVATMMTKVREGRSRERKRGVGNAKMYEFKDMESLSEFLLAM